MIKEEKEETKEKLWTSDNIYISDGKAEYRINISRSSSSESDIEDKVARALSSPFNLKQFKNKLQGKFIYLLE